MRWAARLLRPFREHPRHPSRRECGWKREAQWRARALRCKYAPLDQSRNNTARLPVAGINDIGCVAARQLAAIEHGFENTSGFRRKMAQSDLFLGPYENAGAQAIRLNELFHEPHLVYAHFQEESRESGKSFFAQIAAPIKIVPAGPIAIGEMTFVRRDISGEAACNRPDSTRIQSLKRAACDTSLATRPLPSTNGCIHSRR
jgi:hypothetical protein